ncbi:MAG: response regulator transcription factor [Cellulosilyticaceae bacterium]
MLNVIIIDDESFIVKSLISSIPWKALGFDIVATFENGADALDYISNNLVHLVITDIRMPGISGLDLCDYIYNHFPNIQLIIISGYADFTYAQKAIKYNVLGYCIKPLDYTELTTLLRKAIVNTSNVDPSSYDILDAIESRDIPFLDSYISSCQLDPKKLYLMVSIGATALPSPSTMPYKKVKLGMHRYLYISSSPFGYSALSPEKLTALGIKGIGIYPVAIGTDTLSLALTKTIAMAYHFFFYDTPICCHTLPQSDSQNFLNKLKRVLTSRHVADIEEVLSSLYTLDDYSNFSVDFSMKLWHIFMVYRTDYSQLELEDYSIYSYDDLYQKFDSFKQMLNSLIDLLHEDLSPTELQNTHNNTFIYILQFINHNYMHNISLADIASNFHLSQSYVSQLFKKETSTTYTEYIGQLRIQKAKELLLDSKLSLTEISEKIGYNDYFYFLKSFKKYTSISPGKYRSLGGVIPSDSLAPSTSSPLSN